MAIYQNKPILALSATPGPRAGAGVLSLLEGSAPFFGADLRGTLGVGVWSDAFDNDKNELTRESDPAALDKALAALATKHWRLYASELMSAFARFSVIK